MLVDEKEKFCLLPSSWQRSCQTLTYFIHWLYWYLLLDIYGIYCDEFVAFNQHEMSGIAIYFQWIDLCIGLKWPFLDKKDTFEDWIYFRVSDETQSFEYCLLATSTTIIPYSIWYILFDIEYIWMTVVERHNDSMERHSDS